MGKALQVLTDLHLAERASWPATKGALQCRFSQQIFADSAKDKLVARMHRMATPTFNKATPPSRKKSSCS